MLKTTVILLASIGIAVLGLEARCQQPARKPGDEPAREKKDYGNSPIVTKMMAFNKKKDGKLTRDEVTDERLLRLFDLADTNKDGVVTKAELMVLAEKLEAEAPQGGQGGPRGPGGPDGPGGRGPGGRFGPPRPGQILPEFMQDQLKLTDEQKKKLADLQKDVDEKLEKLLTADQRKQLKEMRERGPGGRGGPDGGPGGGRRGGGPGAPPDRR